MIDKVQARLPLTGILFHLKTVKFQQHKPKFQLDEIRKLVTDGEIPLAGKKDRQLLTILYH